MMPWRQGYEGWQMGWGPLSPLQDSEQEPSPPFPGGHGLCFLLGLCGNTCISPPVFPQAFQASKGKHNNKLLK
jgi:hypothetical protein